MPPAGARRPASPRYGRRSSTTARRWSRLAAMAQATSRIELGSAIAYAFGRTPLVLAAEARDLDELSGGRLTLGLGTGTRRMQQDWHGLDGEHPASRMEELVPLLRRLWRLHEGPIDHEGRFYRLKVQPTAPPREPYRLDTPIYMAGVNARMVEAAGAVADGLIGHPLFTPEYVTRGRPASAGQGRRAGGPRRLRRSPATSPARSARTATPRAAAPPRSSPSTRPSRPTAPPIGSAASKPRPTRSATPGRAATARPWSPRSPTR